MGEKKPIFLDVYDLKESKTYRSYGNNHGMAFDNLVEKFGEDFLEQGDRFKVVGSEKGLSEIGEKLFNESFQLKPGKKIPSEIQTKSNELVAKFIDKNVFKFNDIVSAVQKAFGDETLTKIFPALKAGYTAYLTNASDEETGKMDDFNTIKKSNIEDFITKTEKKQESVLVSRPFIQAVRAKIRSGEVLTKTQLEKLAKEYDITDPNVAKEQAELAIVTEARKIIDEEPDEKKAFDKLVELYNNQPNLTHRTSESVDKQQYSTPAPIAYLTDLFVADGVQNGDVLEPSGGSGMLTIGFSPEQVSINEIDPIRNQNLRQTNYDAISSEDALKNDNLFNKKFDGIVTNPPFGSAELKKFNNYKLKKLEHIMAANALEQMSDKGRGGIIIGGHNRYDNKGRLQSDRTFFNWLYHHYNVSDVINIDGDLYKKQGTQFPIRMILVNGRKQTPSGAAPLKDEIKNKVVSTFEDLFNRIAEVRNETILQPGANADRGNSNITNVPGSGKLPTQKPSGTTTIPGEQISKPNEGKPTKSGQTGSPDKGLSPTGKPISGKPEGVSGTDIEQSGIHTGTTKRGTGKTGKVDNGRSTEDLQKSFDRKPTTPVSNDILVSDKPNLTYEPQSEGVKLDTVIPKNMAYETARTLKRFADDIGGDIDEWVKDKLGYKNKEELFSHVGAEQIDAVALAIGAIEKNQGMIIGDMAGIGKGRVAASIVRYGVLNGYKPIFFTEKADLFSDFYRDLVDIGSAELKPFIINSPSTEISPNIVDQDGNVIYVADEGASKR